MTCQALEDQTKPFVSYIALFDVNLLYRQARITAAVDQKLLENFCMIYRNAISFDHQSFVLDFRKMGYRYL